MLGLHNYILGGKHVDSGSREKRVLLLSTEVLLSSEPDRKNSRRQLTCWLFVYILLSCVSVEGLLQGCADWLLVWAVLVVLSC